ncbi:MAG: YbaK/EbsC family protein [Desulfosarcinaceae bacterium]|nr:YbaK/EbsC family protein [Desulfosarcinaceae bacterium]
MPPRNANDLERFIATHGLTATILPLSQPTATVNDAARALGVANEQIIKSLVFMLHDLPLLVITNGLGRVDRKKLGVALGVGRKRVKFADPAQALAATGFSVGSMPPFGHRRALRTLVDKGVLRFEAVYGGGGDGDTMMRLTTAELIQFTGAEVVDIAASPPVAG